MLLPIRQDTEHVSLLKSFILYFLFSFVRCFFFFHLSRSPCFFSNQYTTQSWMSTASPVDQPLSLLMATLTLDPFAGGPGPLFGEQKWTLPLSFVNESRNSLGQCCLWIFEDLSTNKNNNARNLLFIFGHFYSFFASPASVFVCVCCRLSRSLQAGVLHYDSSVFVYAFNCLEVIYIQIKT